MCWRPKWQAERLGPSRAGDLRMEARRGQVPQQRDWYTTAIPEAGQARNQRPWCYWGRSGVGRYATPFRIIYACPSGHATDRKPNQIHIWRVSFFLRRWGLLYAGAIGLGIQLSTRACSHYGASGKQIGASWNRSEIGIYLK